MRPYYERGGVVLYHGDCREVLPGLVAVDAIVTDPPYGMDYKPARGADGSKRFTNADRVIGDGEPFDPTHLLGYPAVVLWGANWYADRLPASGGWIVWDKTPHGIKRGFVASHAELAWTNVMGRTLKFAMQWGGEAHGGEPHYHPTQKPVALSRWLLREVVPSAALVADPYAGSGSLLRAAQEEGRPAVGVEAREDYCEVIARRLDAALDGVRPEERAQGQAALFGESA